jgi:hypothetical protein
MDIIGFINSQSPVSEWDAAKKTAMLNDLADYFNYTLLVSNEDNPPTKKAFVNSKIKERIMFWVNKQRTESAIKNIAIENLDIT